MIIICSICLCTGQTSRIMLQTLEGPLRKFYDELCGKGNDFSDALYCPICAHLLRKFYNFRNKCLKANGVLTEWKKQHTKPREQKSKLYKKLPPTSLGLCNNTNHNIYYYNDDDSKGYKELNISSSDKHIIIKPILDIKEECDSNTFTDTNECNKALTEAHEYNEALTEINTDIQYLDFDMLDSDITDAEIKAESDDDHFLVNLANTEKELNASQRFYDDGDKTNFDNVVLNNDNTKGDNRSTDVTTDVTTDVDVNCDNDKNEDDDINDEIGVSQDVEDDNLDDDINDDIDVSQEVEVDSSNDKVIETGRKRKRGYSIAWCLKKVFENDLTNDEVLLIKRAVFSTRQELQAAIKEHDKELELAYEEMMRNNYSAQKRKKLMTKEEILSVEMNQVKKELKSKLENGDVKDKDGNIIDVVVILNNLEKLTKATYTKLKKNCAGDGPLTPRAINLLSQVHKRYGNLYSSVFVTKHLTTDEEVMEAFKQREHDPSYIKSEHKCTKCLRYFKSAKSLDYHNSELHNPNKPYKCQYCDVSFNRPQALRRHLLAHKVVYQCKLCPLVTNYTSVRDVHFNIHKGVKYPCTKCNAVFRTPQVLFAHTNRSHHVVSLVCPFCALAFYSEGGLHLHKMRKHADIMHTEGPPTAKCEQCDLQFISDEVYLEHRKKSHGTNAKKDRNLSREKSNKIGKKKKKPERRGTPKYTCRVCATVVSSIGALVTHFKSSHPQNSSDMSQMALRPPHKYLCDQCGKGFNGVSLLEDHKNVHSGLRPYSCPDCPKSFHIRGQLHNHSLFHAPPHYQCDVCGKKFKSSANLYNHKRTHKGDRRYACDLCGKTFLHQCAVTAHVRGVHLQIRRQRKRI